MRRRTWLLVGVLVIGISLIIGMAIFMVQLDERVIVVATQLARDRLATALAR